MKRLLRNLLIVALALVVVLCVIYRVVLSSSTPNEELALDARVTAILEDGGCLSCHIAEPELPFYANFPVVGKLVKQDAQDGYRAYDIAYKASIFLYVIARELQADKLLTFWRNTQNGKEYKPKAPTR